MTPSNSTGKLRKTARGFHIREFRDRYENPCSLQKSSLATEDCIWLGVDGNRMHLTQGMVRELLPYLQAFAETGDLAPQPEPTCQKPTDPWGTRCTLCQKPCPLMRDPLCQDCYKLPKDQVDESPNDDLLHAMAEAEKMPDTDEGYTDDVDVLMKGLE